MSAGRTLADATGGVKQPALSGEGVGCSHLVAFRRVVISSATMLSGDFLSQLASRDARRICIIKPSALGDIVQTLPLLAVLRRRFPRATIHWVVNRGFRSLLDGHPDLEEVIPFDRRGSWSALARLLIELRRRQFDLVFDLQGLFRSAVMTWATGAPLRVGLETAREGAHRACHAIVPGTGRNVPAHARWRNIARALGVTSLPDSSGLIIPGEARSWASGKLRGLGRPILAVHAGAGWETKRWPIESFAELAARFPGGVVTVGSREEQRLAATISTSVKCAGGDVLDLSGTTTLPQLAAVLAEVDLVLSNDSGPLHLAAAAGTPVVGIYTCTSPVQSGPAGSGHELVAANVSCAASYCKRCPQRGDDYLACLTDVTVDRVHEAVLRTLAARSPRRESA